MGADSVRIGRRFKRLAVVSEDEPYLWRGRFSGRRWLCACDCGGEAVVREDRLRGGSTLTGFPDLFRCRTLKPLSCPDPGLRSARHPEMPS